VVAVALGWLWSLLGTRPTANATDGRGQEGATDGRGFMGAPPLRSLWPGIVADWWWHCPACAVAVAGLGRRSADDPTGHEIYVFERLPHHLVLTRMRPDFILRLTLLWAFWLLLPRIWPCDATVRRLRAFVTGSVVIALIGVVIHALLFVDRTLAATAPLYWFRATDVALPLGVALEVGALIVRTRTERPVAGGVGWR